jgi:hypothetical protein
LLHLVGYFNLLKRGFIRTEKIKTLAVYVSQSLMTERRRSECSRGELFIGYSLSETEKNIYRQSFVCDYLQLINMDMFTSVLGNGNNGDRTKATDLLVFATYAYKLDFYVALTAARPSVYRFERALSIIAAGYLF